MGQHTRLAILAAIVVLLTVAVAAVAATFVLGLGTQTAMTGQQSGQVGLSAGGAQDATAFRRNVREGYVPQPTDLTYEGLFHDYYFETQSRQSCEQLFCPSYSRAVTRDPLSNETERYLSVGLNSGLSQAEFERPNVTMVVVLDTSGSMDGQFSEYHYDETGGRETPAPGDRETTRKIDAATDAVTTLLDRLGPDDRLAVVTYSDGAQVVQQPRRIDEIDRGRLQQRIQNQRANGGTNLDAGMETARELVEGQPDDSNRSTRLVYLTDAMPNLGETGGESLESRVRDHANDGVYSTFVGVGVDFNSRLTETISTLRGANYYSIHSAERFRERMDEGFAYMVTPLVFDLSVTVRSDAYEIESVYGSPQADQSTGEVLEVATLFPSRREDNRTEGGVILVELAATNESTPDGGTAEIVASYETRDGESQAVTRTVEFEAQDAPHYDDAGVRKAVALTRYATLMRNWMIAERESASAGVTAAEGIERRTLGEWEQQSVSLSVSRPWGERIRQFREYFGAERDALGDESMQRELDVMARLLETAPAATGTPTRTTGAETPVS